MGTRSILSAALALIGATLPAAAQRTPQPRCRYGEWSSPRAAFTGSRVGATVARAASLASIGETTFIAGNDVPFFSPDTVRGVPLALARLGGDGIGRPTGPFRFIGPKLLSDQRGRLHLLWGEPANAAAPIAAKDWTDQGIASLWTALYEPGRGWSPARKVSERRPLGWTEATSTDGDGRVGGAAVVVTVDTHRAWPGVVEIFRLQRDSLISSIADIFASPSYRTVTADGRIVYLAFIAASRDRRPGQGRIPDNNSVWLQRSPDGGATWEKEVLVSLSGGEPAHKIRIHVTPNHHVHLLWRKDYPGAASVIRHVESADSGRSWSTPDDVRLSASRFSNLHSAVDACGALQVIHEYMDPNTGAAQIEAAVWNGRWSRAERLMFDGLRIGGLALSRAPDGRLHLVFLSQPTQAPVSTPPTMLYRERVPGGER